MLLQGRNLWQCMCEKILNYKQPYPGPHKYKENDNKMIADGKWRVLTYAFCYVNAIHTSFIFTYVAKPCQVYVDNIIFEF